jgi:NAD(P)H-dependent flavin oxidoreductase YrpB (nitropropane dioxygenase family)
MNRVCQILKIEKPVIQAPMLWITSPELVAAVSNAGGLGVLGFNAGTDVRRPLFFALAEKGYPILSLEPVSANLEDVFLQLVENGGVLPTDEKPKARQKKSR